ncbi:reverse transcriptase domain-containing protein [Tanacetum coccineum]
MKTSSNLRVLRIILVILPEHQSDTKVFTMTKEILLEPTSNKLCGSQEVTKIFPSTPYRGYYRSTHQTNNIPPRCGRTITKMERYAGRTQYHVPAKDIRERTDPSGFPCREARRNTTRYVSGRNTSRAVDIIHGRVVMCRWVRRWPDTDKPGGNRVLVEVLKEKSIQEKEVATVVEEEGPTWMTPIAEYLRDGTLPDDKKEASKLRIKARQYELVEGVLYRRSFLTPWLRCVGPLQADYVIREIQEGSCSMHAGPRSVVAKAMRLGYYWPTMHRDAREMIRACNDCQVHHPVPRNPQQPLTPITTPWPFYKWGIDIAGPFLEGPGKVNILIVAMDYFTKWIKAKAVATITGNQVKKFVWDNIVCCFGLLEEIVSDNGKQFSDNPFKDWCEKLNIIQRFASVKHPQSNVLVERANRSLSKGIKARLGEGNKN